MVPVQLLLQGAAGATGGGGCYWGSHVEVFWDLERLGGLREDQEAAVKPGQQNRQRGSAGE